MSRAWPTKMLDMAASNASQEMLDMASSSEAIRCDEVMDEIDWIAFHEYISTSLFLAAELLWKLGLVDFDCVMHYLQRLPVCVQRRLLLRRRCTLNWRTDNASLELAQQLLANFNKLGPESLHKIIVGQVIMPSAELLKNMHVVMGTSGEEFLRQFKSQFPGRKSCVPQALRTGNLTVFSNIEGAAAYLDYVNDHVVSAWGLIQQQLLEPDSVDITDAIFNILKQQFLLPTFRVIMVQRFLGLMEPRLSQNLLAMGKPAANGLASINFKGDLADFTIFANHSMQADDDLGVLKVVEDLGIPMDQEQSHEHLLCEYDKATNKEGGQLYACENIQEAHAHYRLRFYVAADAAEVHSATWCSVRRPSKDQGKSGRSQEEEVVPNYASMCVAFASITGMAPRRHQLEAIHCVLASIGALWTGTCYLPGRYLVQHATGSGKSKTMGLLARILIGEYHFKGIVFIVDRKDLLQQLMQETNAFFQDMDLDIFVKPRRLPIPCGVFEAIKPFVVYSTAQSLMKQNGSYGEVDVCGPICVFADEAHRTQNERSIVAKVLDDCYGQCNLHLIGWTATPTPMCLERYGSVVPEVSGTCRLAPCHAYTYRDALDDGCILDPLTNYEEHLGLTTLGKAQCILVKYQHCCAKMPYVPRGLVVCRSIAAVREMTQALRDQQQNNVRSLLDDPIVVEAVFSNTDGGESDAALNAINHLQDAHLRVVCKKCLTGYNDPDLSLLVLDAGLMPKHLTMQVLGRLVRCRPKKVSAVLSFGELKMHLLESIQTYSSRRTMQISSSHWRLQGASVQKQEPASIVQQAQDCNTNPNLHSANPLTSPPNLKCSKKNYTRFWYYTLGFLNTSWGYTG